MNDANTEDEKRFDDAVRGLLMVPANDLVAHERRSLSNTTGRLREVPLLATRKPRRRRAGTVVALATVVVAAIALAPPFHSTDLTHSVPALTPDATAAETLQWAGHAVLVTEDPAVGDGAVWHAVAVTTRDGQVVGARERWLDTRSPAWSERALTTTKWMQLWVSTFEDDLLRGRGYRRDASTGEWSVPPMFGQIDVPGGMNVSAEMFGGPPPRVIGRVVDGRERPIDDPAPDLESIKPYRVSATVGKEEATRRWVRAAARTTDTSDLERATEIFLRTTRGHFAGMARDANPNARRATTVRQLLHLLTIARSRPEAMRVLYDEFAQIDKLRRLSNVVVDGRPALRIQFEFGDLSGTREVELGGPEMEQLLLDGEVVLVIDRSTGAPLRTESVDRATWTELRPARLVQSLGDEPVLCREVLAEQVPCDLLEGRGRVAEKADQIARSPRFTAFGELGGGDVEPMAGYSSWNPDKLSHMRLDDDGLPLDDPDQPLAYTKSQWGQPVPIYPLAPLPDN
jgi:hypothetical protein